MVLSVRLFAAIDQASQSATDTLLGFVPNDLVVWAVAVALVWWLRRAAASARR